MKEGSYFKVMRGGEMKQVRLQGPTSGMAWNLSPLMREFQHILRDRRIDMQDLGEVAGVHKQCFWRWAHGADPGLSFFVAAANALGYDLVLVKRAPIPEATEGDRSWGKPSIERS